MTKGKKTISALCGAKYPRLMLQEVRCLQRPSSERGAERAPVAAHRDLSRPEPLSGPLLGPRLSPGSEGAPRAASSAARCRPRDLGGRGSRRRRVLARPRSALGTGAAGEANAAAPERFAKGKPYVQSQGTVFRSLCESLSEKDVM